ncbi:lipopolysaccharide biosynthesis protein [Pseudidiomarina salilacus]|uniref:lipopolysaccharide biosynthesis protein n=1 Tax=Pseudidiomarina salilacus TaxID=3384452 RepID=UPI0039847F48
MDRKFFTSIATLVSGTAFAQLASLLFVPWITRLYGPDAFGGLGYFSALLSFLTPLAALSYPLALVLPKRDSEARGLLELSFLLAFVATFLLVCVFYALAYLTPSLFPFSYAAVLVPLAVALSVAIAAYTQWAIRDGHFRLVATVTLLTALLGGAGKVALGYVMPNTMALILVTCAVLLINLWVLVKNVAAEPRLSRLTLHRKKYVALAQKYLRFPFFRMPHALLALVSQMAPIFLLTSFFGAKYAGFFVLTRTVLAAPVSLIGKAVYDVSYPKIAKRHNAKQANFYFITKLTLVLVGLSIVPLVIIFAAGELLFAWAFGSEWGTAGVYAAWMSLWFTFNFSNKAIAAAVSVYSLDAFLFINGLLNAVLSLGGFLIGAFAFASDVAAVALFSLFSIVCQVLLIAKVLRVVKHADAQLT